MIRIMSRTGFAILLASVLLPATIVAAKAPAREETAQDLVLAVSLAPGEAALVDVDVAPRRNEKSGTRDGWDARPLQAGEVLGDRNLVLTFYDSKRERLGSWVAPAVGMAFYDEVSDDEKRTLGGGVSYPATHERLVRLPLPERASWLTLTVASAGPPAAGVRGRCDESGCFRCKPVGPGTLVPESFAAYPLARTEGAQDVSAFVDAVAFAPPAAGLPEILLRPSCLERPVFLDNPFRRFLCPCGEGCALGVLRLHGSAPPESAFDVVILGDGFALEDLTKLRSWAMRYTDGLLATEPFASREQFVNVHLVLTASASSGVTNCPEPNVRRSTYFQVEGHWPNVGGIPGGPAHFGTRAMCRVRLASRLAAPLPQIEAIVMIANCGERGGNADPANRLAFLSLHDDNERFEDFGLHESAHAMAWLGDEYLGCAPVEPVYSYPRYRANLVPEAEMANAWWKVFALKDASGAFKWIHKCGDPFGSQCMPKVDGQVVGASAVGVFWGSMFGNATGPAGCNQCTGQVDESGCLCTASCEVYRPVPKACKMHFLSRDFCPVCEEVLCQAVRRAAPGAAPCRLTSWPP